MSDKCGNPVYFQVQFKNIIGCILQTLDAGAPTCITNTVIDLLSLILSLTFLAVLLPAPGATLVLSINLNV